MIKITPVYNSEVIMENLSMKLISTDHKVNLKKNYRNFNSRAVAGQTTVSGKRTNANLQSDFAWYRLHSVIPENSQEGSNYNKAIVPTESR